MTEDEAKTKWCPFARVIRASETGIVAADQAAHNRADTPRGLTATPTASLCIASACMAWREHGYSGGYCGLSGVPQ